MVHTGQRDDVCPEISFSEALVQRTSIRFQRRAAGRVEMKRGRRCSKSCNMWARVAGTVFDGKGWSAGPWETWLRPSLARPARPQPASARPGHFSGHGLLCFLFCCSPGKAVILPQLSALLYLKWDSNTPALKHWGLSTWFTGNEVNKWNWGNWPQMTTT